MKCKKKATLTSKTWKNNRKSILYCQFKDRGWQKLPFKSLRHSIRRLVRHLTKWLRRFHIMRCKIKSKVMIVLRISKLLTQRLSNFWQDPVRLDEQLWKSILINLKIYQLSRSNTLEAIIRKSSMMTKMVVMISHLFFITMQSAVIWSLKRPNFCMRASNTYLCRNNFSKWIIKIIRVSANLKNVDTL